MVNHTLSRALRMLSFGGDPPNFLLLRSPTSRTHTSSASPPHVHTATHIHPHPTTTTHYPKQGPFSNYSSGSAAARPFVLLGHRQKATYCHGQKKISCRPSPGQQQPPPPPPPSNCWPPPPPRYPARLFASQFPGHHHAHPQQRTHKQLQEGRRSDYEIRTQSAWHGGPGLGQFGL